MRLLWIVSKVLFCFVWGGGGLVECRGGKGGVILVDDGGKGGLRVFVSLRTPFCRVRVVPGPGPRPHHLGSLGAEGIGELGLLGACHRVDRCLWGFVSKVCSVMGQVSMDISVSMQMLVPRQSSTKCL